MICPKSIIYSKFHHKEEVSSIFLMPRWLKTLKGLASLESERWEAIPLKNNLTQDFKIKMFMIIMELLKKIYSQSASIVLISYMFKIRCI